MKARHALLVALVAAVTLTSVAAAGPDAAKQRVAISMKLKEVGNGTFVLMPLQSGTLKRDSGTVTVVFNDPTIVMRDGQRIDIFRNTYTVKGKRGTHVDSRADRVCLRSRTKRSRASISRRVSASARGRSWAGRARTPRSPEADGVASRASPGSRSSRASSLVDKPAALRRAARARAPPTSQPAWCLRRTRREAPGSGTPSAGLPAEDANAVARQKRS